LSISVYDHREIRFSFNLSENEIKTRRKDFVGENRILEQVPRN